MDNYDSFTENLRHLLLKVRPEYSFSVHRNNDRSVFDRQWDGFVISPGPKSPSETGILKEFFEKVVLPRKLPVLGVCLGMQFLAWFYGLAVSPADDARHGRTVEMSVKNTDIFKGLGRTLKAMRYNSLAIDATVREIEEKTDLIVTAVQSEGDMIMALKHNSLPFTAVQFHPESFLTEKAESMMENFFRDYIDG